MKNLFIISEEEKNRILEMHQDATKRQYLSEQSATAYTMSQESIPAREFILKTFKLGKYSSSQKMTIDDLKRAKGELINYNMNQLTDLAKKSNVSPEAIKALQSDLLKIAGVPLKFKDSTGQERDFIDGNLGTNTVDAYLDYQIKVLSRAPSTVKPTTTVPVQQMKDVVKPVYQRK